MEPKRITVMLHFQQDSKGDKNIKPWLEKESKPIIIEPPHGKTNNLHRRKQRRRSASQ